MKRFQIMMPEPLMEELKAIAKLKGVAASEIIRRACEDYLTWRRTGVQGGDTTSKKLPVVE